MIQLKRSTSILRLNILRIVLLLCLVTIAPISSFSQDTLKISSEQLRTTNLIFLEHKKLKTQVPLLKTQIFNLEQIDQSWAHTDSIQKDKLRTYEIQVFDRDQHINYLNKSLKAKKKIIQYGTIGSVLIILCLLLK